MAIFCHELSAKKSNEKLYLQLKQFEMYSRNGAKSHELLRVTRLLPLRLIVIVVA